jgi:hypothetical protein
VSSGDEGFLTRWSRLKRAEAPVPDPATEPVPAPAAPAADGPADDRPRDPETGAPIDEDWVKALPRIDDLGPGADLSGFMRAGVPEALRREALRRVWEIDPAIRDFVSPALDYAYDYNTPGAAPGYGPLSESDIAQAKRFLDTVFSDPPRVDDIAHSGERIVAPRQICDVESQSAHDDTGIPRQAIAPEHPVAAQHDLPPDVATDTTPEPQQAAEILASSAVRLSGPAMRQENDIAAAQHDAGSESQQLAPRRRRGGTATPV